MTHRKNKYNNYDDEDFYNEAYYDEDFKEDDDQESEEEYEDNDVFDGEDIDDDDAVIAELPPAYDKDNPVDFVQLMQDYRSENPYKEEMAVDKAVRSLEGLIRHIIKKKYAQYANQWYEDLLQSGRLGVCNSLPMYDPEKSKPSTYFYRHILHEMHSFINEMVNKTSSHYDASVRKIKKVISKYNKEGRPYTAIDISIDTGLPVQTIEQSLLLINSSETSIDGPSNALGYMQSDDKPLDQQYVEEEELRALEAAMAHNLDDVEIRILEMVYGIHGQPQMNTKEISKEVGLPTDRVRKYAVTARYKLRESKELKSIRADLLKNTFLEVDEENAIPLLAGEDLDAALEIMRNVEIDF